MYLSVRGVLFLLVVYQIRESVCDIERFDTGVEEHEREEEQKRQDQRKLILEVLNEERQEMLQAQLQDYKNLRHEIRYLSIEIATLKNEKNETETKYKQEIDDMKDELKFYDLSIKELRKDVEVLQHADVQINRKLNSNSQQISKIENIENGLNEQKKLVEKKASKWSIGNLKEELKSVKQELTKQGQNVEARLDDVEKKAKILYDVVAPKMWGTYIAGSKVGDNEEKVNNVEKELKKIEEKLDSHSNEPHSVRNQNSKTVLSDITSRLEDMESKTKILDDVVKQVKDSHGNHNLNIQANEKKIEELSQEFLSVKEEMGSTPAKMISPTQHHQSSYNEKEQGGHQDVSYDYVNDGTNDTSVDDLRNEVKTNLEQVEHFLFKDYVLGSLDEERSLRDWIYDEFWKRHYFLDDARRVYSSSKAVELDKASLHEKYHLIFENDMKGYYRYTSDVELRGKQHWKYDSSAQKYFFTEEHPNLNTQVKVYSPHHAVEQLYSEEQFYLIYKKGDIIYRYADEVEQRDKQNWIYDYSSSWRNHYFEQWNNYIQKQVRVYSNVSGTKDSKSEESHLVVYNKEKGYYYRFANDYEMRTEKFIFTDELNRRYFIKWSFRHNKNIVIFEYLQ